MEMQAFLAAHYRKLQLLRLAPIWGLCIAEPWMPHLPLSSFLLGGCAVLVLCALFYVLAGRYYEKRYGMVETTTTFDKSYAIVVVVVMLPILIYSLVLGKGIPTGFALMFLPCYVLGEGFSANNLASRRIYYILIGFFLFAYTTPAYISVVPGHHFFTRYILAIVGAPMLILSVMDHLTLRNSFRRVSLG
jgi:hypothetical protein